MLQEIQILQEHNNCVVVTSGPEKTNFQKRLPPILPAASNNENYNMNNQDLLKCRKKMNYKTKPYAGPQTASIARRNARERNRVQQVNDGFAALRRHLPTSVIAALSNNARRSSSKKLSKVDTLRMVVEYIRYLQQLLEDSEQNNDSRLSMDTSFETSLNNYASRLNESVLTSSYDDFPASPSPSETSSGVSSGYYRLEPQELSPMQEDDLLDVISWWQQK